MRTIALLLCLSARWLYADPALPFNLAGEWKFIADDNPAYAQPGFDDLTWSTTPLPRADTAGLFRPLSEVKGVSWLRARFMLPSETPQEPLFLTLGTLAEAYEVWCNGVRIGDTGGFSERDAHFARPRTFTIPSGLLKPGQPFTLALRANFPRNRGPRVRMLIALSDPGPYFVTAADRIPKDAAALEILRREKLVAMGYVSSALHVFLILMLLGGWLTDRARGELLFLSILLGADLGARFSESLFVSLDASLRAYYVTATFSYLSAPLLALFALRVFRIRSRLVYYAICIPWTLLFAWLAYVGNPFQTISGILLVVTDFAVVILSIRAGYPAFRSGSGKSGSVLMAVSIGLIAALHTQRIGPIQVVSLFLPFAGYLFHLYDVAVITLSALMTQILLLSLGTDRREKLRLASELESARTVQQLLFPKPSSGNIDAVYCPANEVGGDFWQALPAAGGGEIIVVGDVSGKGLRAAMMVSLLTGALRNRRSDSPAEILAELNRVAVSASHTGFVTAMVAHVKEGRATIANAGHPAPYLNGEEVTLDAALPLGIDAEAVYTEREMAFSEQLTFVSDGVIEAENARRELFGFERTREISGVSAQEIADAARAWGQNDDITVVTVKTVAA